MNGKLRAATVTASLLTLLLGATSLWAQGPSGASPSEGVAAACTFQPLAAGASVWIKVPYTSDYRLQFTLDSGGAGGVNFDVYPSEAAAKPIGSGSKNSNEAMHDLNWEGRLQANGFFYILVKNANAFPVSYRFCVTVKDPFYSPPSTATEVPCFATDIAGAPGRGDSPAKGNPCLR
jgi:hypothetical protein